MMYNPSVCTLLGPLFLCNASPLSHIYEYRHSACISSTSSAAICTHPPYVMLLSVRIVYVYKRVSQTSTNPITRLRKKRSFTSVIFFINPVQRLYTTLTPNVDPSPHPLPSFSLLHMCLSPLRINCLISLLQQRKVWY